MWCWTREIWLRCGWSRWKYNHAFGTRVHQSKHAKISLIHMSDKFTSQSTRAHISSGPVSYSKPNFMCILNTSP